MPGEIDARPAAALAPILLIVIGMATSLQVHTAGCLDFHGSDNHDAVVFVAQASRAFQNRGQRAVPSVVSILPERLAGLPTNDSIAQTVAHRV